MGCFPSFFSDGCVLFFWDYYLIRSPEIGETVTGTRAVWNGLPQSLTRLFAAIPNRVSNDLAGLAAEGDPNPTVLRFFEYKRPQFVHLQYDRSGICWVRSKQSRRERGKLHSFFLI